MTDAAVLRESNSPKPVAPPKKTSLTNVLASTEAGEPMPGRRARRPSKDLEAELEDLKLEKEKGSNGTPVGERVRRKSKELEETMKGMLKPDLKKVFDKIDQDKSGYIEADELQAALKMAGKPHSDRAVAKMMAEHDVDKNGKLDIDEFVTIAWEVVKAYQ